MKILVVCQYYYPEPVRITDICEELVKKGHKVTILTDYPNYPMGNIYDGYKNKEHIDEKINGVKIHRCFTIPRKKGIIMRILNYYSFALSSTLYAKKIKEDYDVVFVNQLSPVMMTCAGIKYKKKHTKKLVLYCLDIWPESLKVGGIKEKSIIFKLFHLISKKIYNKCDKILISSKSFEKYLKEEFNIKEEKIKYLPQYAESLFEPKKCKKEKNQNIDLLFAGNMGTTQSLDTIIDAAIKMKDYENLYWHFVGDGIEYNRLKEKVKKNNLKNVTFYGRKPVEDMPKYYKKADAMLISLQGNSAVSYTLPGKIQTYMAAGKPIIGAIDGEAQEIIKLSNCGFCGPADNVEELVKNIKKFIKSENKEQLEKNSELYYKEHFEKEQFMNNLIEELKNNCK